MFKVYHCSHPAIIQKLFSKNPNQNNRQKHHFKIPFTRSKSLENSIAVQGPKMYNRLFHQIDINCSIFTYKKHIKPNLVIVYETLFPPPSIFPLRMFVDSLYLNILSFL